MLGSNRRGSKTSIGESFSVAVLGTDNLMDVGYVKVCWICYSCLLDNLRLSKNMLSFTRGLCTRHPLMWVYLQALGTEPETYKLIIPSPRIPGFRAQFSMVPKGSESGIWRYGL